jgi:F-type H+-transporting ATPase subunit gamma
MESIEGLKKRIGTTQELQTVVKTMKALAATNIRQYEQAVESLAEYYRTVAMGLQVSLKSIPVETALIKPAPTRRLGAIVFGSDQGLCGQLNEQIASHALQTMDKFNPSSRERRLLVIGTRVTSYLEDAGQRVEERLAVPSSRNGITLVAQDILAKVEEWQALEGVDHIMLFYHALISSSGYAPQTLHLLPIDFEWLHQLEQTPWPFKILPLCTLEWEQMFSLLIRQYLFVSLSRALAESLASENSSRLASMQRAERNIGQHLELLQSQFYQQRQTSITEELLDIIGGFEALTKPQQS